MIDFAALHVTDELNLGDLVVGGGTLALAWFTWRLARKTSESVAIGERGLELTRESIEAQDRPFLVASFSREQNIPDIDYSPIWDEPDSDQPSGFEMTLSASVENIGNGPAVLEGATITQEMTEADRKEAVWSAEYLFKPGEQVNLGVPLPENHEEGDRFELHLLYRSPTGYRYETRHRFLVRKHQRTARLDVRRIALG